MAKGRIKQSALRGVPRGGASEEKSVLGLDSTRKLLAS